LLSDFYGQSLICELILALFSLWLLVNSIKKNPKEKRPIDFFDYFIQRYFDYFIIILPLLVLNVVTHERSVGFKPCPF